MSNTEPDVEHHNVVTKRQRTHGSAQQASSSSPSKIISEDQAELSHRDSTRNSSSTMASGSQSRPLKGRKRFMADLKDVMASCAAGFEVQGLGLTQVENGDDEGSILCEVVKSVDGQHVLTFTMLVTDTSEYPSNHSWICFAQDESLSPDVLDIIQGAADAGSRTILDMVNKLLTSLAKKVLSTKMKTSITEELYEDSDGGSTAEDDESVYNGHSDDEDFGGQFGITALNSNVDFDLSVMKRDFNEIMTLGYRPGLIRIGVSEIVLSVSIPTFRLAGSIATRALMAWDPRLLSKSRHFTLVISGIRGKYPVLSAEGLLSKDALTHGTSSLLFRVGLTPKYKPAADQVPELIRTFGMIGQRPPPQDIKGVRYFVHETDTDEPFEEDEVIEDDEAFTFSMSAALESLMNDRFLELVHLRVKYTIGWAAAEALLSKMHRLQKSPEEIIPEYGMEILQADSEEQQLSASYTLPPDPFGFSGSSDHLNLPLLAYSYLLRRLTLCPRFCLICYDKVQTEFQALKPYVCNDKLCTYQYYSLNRGPTLEYEICSRPQTVDLLVSLTYIAAVEGGLSDFPDGMNLQVTLGQSGLCDFDTLAVEQKRAVISKLINTLPPIADIKRYLLKKNTNGRAKPKLQDVSSSVPAAAWSVLRWCVASCTAHLEELTDESDQVANIGPQFRQFRFTVGAPDAEARFYAAQMQACEQDSNAQQFPSVFGFHGSPAKNWHSIIRHGLWCKDVAHGRAYGHGVYFAKDAHYSISGYARPTQSSWSSSEIQVRSCLALAEIVNLPSKFAHASSSFFVVPQTEWIVCRYLLVSGAIPTVMQLSEDDPNTCFIPVDPQHPLTMSGTSNGTATIRIPETSQKLLRLLTQRQEEYIEEGNDEEDRAVLAHANEPQAQHEPVVETTQPVEDDWEHDPEWVVACVQYMLPPPVDASPMAVSSVQRELATMLKEQEKTKSLKELGWYMPPDFIGDNLFQWIVELHSFDPELPVAQDMAARGVNSLVFEIRFPPNFPHAPPFFRILKPRFLPFIQGGGGHITGGGSMCMDLLTTDGWLPSYSIAAVLLQIKLAISNLEPRPARLASNWDSPYAMNEAVEGYQRAAAAHGWTIPDTVNRMTLYG